MECAIQNGHSMVRHLSRSIKLGTADWSRLRSALEEAGTASQPVILLQDDDLYREMARDCPSKLQSLIRYY